MRKITTLIVSVLFAVVALYAQGENTNVAFEKGQGQRQYQEKSLAGSMVYTPKVNSKQRSTSKEPSLIFFEGWESYTDFTTDLSPWTSYQLTSGATYSSSNFDFPGEGEEWAFKAFNPYQTTPPTNENNPPVSGEKYAVAIQYQGFNDNKWLISPAIELPQISEVFFFARSITDEFGLERIRVLVSTTGTDPEDFTQISEGDYLEVPIDWTEFSFDLSDFAFQTVHVAIQYVSYDAFIFMLDDFGVLEYSNTMRLVDVEANGGETISVSLEIENDNEFIGFQADIQLPEGFTYVNESAVINADRISDHEMAVNVVSGNKLRIISYSMTNSAYLGSSGEMVSFSLQTPVFGDEFELQFTASALSDINSNNIITAFYNGLVNLKVLPLVETAEVIDITPFTAVAGGEVIDDGNADVTAYGVVWSTSELPTLEENLGYTVDGSGIGAFVSELFDLEQQTIYYVRAYATNSVGTAYGEQVMFETLESLEPEIETIVYWDFSDETKRTAVTASGNVSDYSSDIGSATINLVGGPVFAGWVLGLHGPEGNIFAPNSNGWDNGSGLKYWQVTTSTLGYHNLAVSSVQRSSNTGPQNFKVQYSIDGSTWTDVQGANILVQNNFTSGVLEPVNLPFACENKEVVHLRWIMTSNVAVNGLDVASGGTNRIDGIQITGYSLVEPATLCYAIDNCDYEITTGGDAEWFAQSDVTYDGYDAAQSGLITHNQQTWMEMTIEGPGRLTFWWRVSSEQGWDFLRFYVNNEQQYYMSGQGNWIFMEHYLGEGQNVVRWAYTKDGSVNANSDCGWVDQVVFEEGVLPIFTLTLEANPSEGGDVFGAGEYYLNDEVEVSADPAEGYYLVSWTIGGTVVSYEESFIYTMPNYDVTIVANFALIPTYILAVLANPENGGTVEGGGEFLEGDMVEVSAFPFEGYQFLNWTWEGEVVSEEAIYSFEMPDLDMTLIANFLAIPEIYVDTELIEATQYVDEVSSSIFTIYNNGTVGSILDISMEVVYPEGKIKRVLKPELIKGNPVYTESIVDMSSISTVGQEVVVPRAQAKSSASVLYLNSMGGGDSNFKTALQSLTNVGSFTELNIGSTTPNVDYLLGFDVVVVATSSGLLNSTQLGDNLASYVDGGGSVLLLQASLCSGSWALAGAIVTPSYSPLPVASYTPSTSVSCTNFIDHPIAASVGSINTSLWSYSPLQGDGISLGYYEGYSYSAAAYNPNKPIVAINVFVANSYWSGDLLTMVQNTIDWFMEGEGWATIDAYQASIPAGESQEFEVTIDATDLTPGFYDAMIVISSNDPVNPEVEIAIQLEVLEPLPTYYILSLVANPVEGGEVEGDGEYLEDEEVTVYAYPFDGYAFVSWTLAGEEVSNSATFTFLMPDSDITLVANFEPLPYIEVYPEFFEENLYAGNSSSSTLTVYNEGVEGSTLEVNLNVQYSVKKTAKGSNPMLIPGESASNESVVANIPEGVINGVTQPKSTPKASNVSVLNLTALGGLDNSFKNALQVLPNIGTYTEVDVRYDTPNVDYMLGYEVVIVYSGYGFSNPTLLGNNLAQYVDAGGRVIILQAALSQGGSYTLQGGIVTSNYSPLSLGTYTTTTSSCTVFVDHPITNSLTNITSGFWTYSTLQGSGISLGNLSSGYPVAAYNPNRPVVAFNVYPQQGYWSGDLLQAVQNTIDWFVDGEGWITIDTYQASIPGGESFDFEVTFDASELIEGTYEAFISIQSNDAQNPEVVVPVTLSVTGLPDIQLSDDFLNFGTLNVNAEGALELAITNIGTSNLSISNISASGLNFSVSDSELEIAPNESELLVVYFTANEVGIYESNLTFNTNVDDQEFISIGLLAEVEAMTLSFMVTNQFEQPVENATISIYPDLWKKSAEAAKLMVRDNAIIAKPRNYASSDVMLLEQKVSSGAAFEYEGSKEGEWIHWDTGEYYTSIGTNSAAQFDIASRWTPADLAPYNGMIISQFSFIPAMQTPSYTFKIWVGADKVEVYSQPITGFVQQVWYTIILDVPHVIDASQDLMFGVYIDTPSGYPAASDAGPAVTWKGDVLRLGTDWVSMFTDYGLNYNWIIQAFVQDADFEPIVLYTDENGEASFEALNGYYTYTVQKDGFEPASGEVEVYNSSEYVEVELYQLPEIYTVTLFAVPEEGGIVEGAGEYEEGSMVTINAYPESGWFFSHWAMGEEVVSFQSEYSFIIESDVELTAYFSDEWPAIAVEPDYIEENLLSGETTEVELTITNVGEGTLYYSIGTGYIGNYGKQAETSEINPAHHVELGKDEVDTRKGNPVSKAWGGPDAFGYTWIDSDEPNGPNYVWNSIVSTGTHLSYVSGCDDCTQLVNLSFGFPFYGGVYSAITVSSNGFIGMNSVGSQHSNQPLPSTNAQPGIIAGFWDDLHTGNSNANIYFQDFGTYAVFQYETVNYFSGGGTVTFQIHVHQSGEILIYYKEITGNTTSCTIGIQNLTQDVGLQVVFNNTYIKNQHAIAFRNTPDWITFEPASGAILAGESDVVSVTLDATNKVEGVYEAYLYVYSNDPEQSMYVIPVVMDVTGFPEISLSDEYVDFGVVNANLEYSYPVTITNTGTATLEVNNFNTNSDFFFVDDYELSIPPYQSAQILVWFSAEEEGVYGANLTFNTNIEGQEEVSIPLSAEVQLIEVLFTVVDNNGDVVDDALVTIYENGYYINSGYTDENGEIVFNDLYAGYYSYQVQKENFDTSSGNFTIVTESVEVNVVLNQHLVRFNLPLAGQTYEVGVDAFVPVEIEAQVYTNIQYWLYLYNNGSWNYLANNYDASGIYNHDYEIPETLPTGSYYFILEYYLNGWHYVNSNSFDLINNTSNIDVTQPYPGLYWISGNNYTIRWNSFNVEQVNISYSTDNGNTWNSIATGVYSYNGYSSGGYNSYYWTIPELDGAYNQSIIRIQNAEDNEVVSYSENFTLLQQPFTFNSPTSEDVYNVGEDEFIPVEIEMQGLSNVDTWIYFNSNGNWTQIAYEYLTGDATLNYEYVISENMPSGEYSFVVQYYVNGNYYYTSSEAFNVVNEVPYLAVARPYQGQLLYVGSSYYIRWNSNNIEEVNIYFSTDNGQDWYQITSEFLTYNGYSESGYNYYYWQVPTWVEGFNDQSLIRIEDASNNEVIAYSPQFVILDSPVHIITPTSETQVPYAGDLEISLDVHISSWVYVYIMNQYGNWWWLNSYYTEGGVSSFSYNTGSLPAGMYRLYVYHGQTGYELYGDYFEILPPVLYTLTLEANPDEYGSVEGAGDYMAGQQVYVYAYPYSGFVFVNWTDEEGEVVSENAAFSFFMPEYDFTLTANFEVYVPEVYTVSLMANPEEGGLVEGAGEYEEYTLVTVTAYPNDGWFFINWTEDQVVVSYNQEYSFEINSDRELVANFGYYDAEISVAPSFFDEYLNVGETVERTLTIQNLGAYNLTYVINLEGMDKKNGSGFSGPVTPIKTSANHRVDYTGDFNLPSNSSYKANTDKEYYVFYDSFENGMGQWFTQTYSGADIWHLSNLSYNSPVTSMWCGVQGTSSYNAGRVNTAVISPSIYLPQSLGNIVIDFWETFSTESGWDFCMVDISTDNGVSWIPLRGTTSSGAPSGSSGGWVNSVIDISAYSGQTVRIRFYFDTVDGVSNNYSGWFVDDVSVRVDYGWLMVDPLSGTLEPDGIAQVNLEFLSGDVEAEYEGNIVVYQYGSNEPLAIVPASLHVTGFPNIWLSEESLNFGPVNVNDQATLPIIISNTGSAQLEISEIFTNSDYFFASETELSIPPYQSAQIWVTFVSLEEGFYSANLILNTNVESQQQVIIPLSAQTVDLEVLFIVMNQDQELVADATVTIFHNSNYVTSGSTNSEGEVAFQGLAPAYYSYNVQKEGHEPSTGYFNLSNSDLQINVTLYQHLVRFNLPLADQTYEVGVNEIVPVQVEVQAYNEVQYWLYLYNNGNWITLANNTVSEPGIFNHDYTLPQTLQSGEYYFILEYYFNGTWYYINSNTFEVINNTSSITVTRPMEGEYWIAGNSYYIRWNSFNVSYVDISYSIDNGESWMPIANEYYSYNGYSTSGYNSYYWQVPSSIEGVNSQSLIRIENSMNEEVVGYSSLFTLLETPFSFLQPIADQVYEVGVDEIIPIEIQMIGLTEVSYWLYLYSYGSWINITNNTIYEPGTYTHQYNIPSNIATGEYQFILEYYAGNTWNYLYSNDFSIVNDVSSISVMRPYEGQTWIAGYEYSIRWNSNNISEVDIYYSLDNGESWTLIAEEVASYDGFTSSGYNYYNWTVPSGIEGAYYESIIRVESSSNVDVVSYSQLFTIIGASLEIISPTADTQVAVGDNVDVVLDVFLPSWINVYLLDSYGNWWWIANSYAYTGIFTTSYNTTGFTPGEYRIYVYHSNTGHEIYSDFFSIVPGQLYDVTFNVDMTNADGFNPEIDDVFITGTMFGWAVPGTQPENQLMTQIEGTMTWTKTLQLYAGYYEYKYFLNYGWDEGEWPGDPNRSIVVTGNMVQNDEWAVIPGYIPICEAVDNCDLNFYTGGDASWFGQNVVTFDGVDAAQSGAISHYHSTWMETSVQGPGVLSFWWKVSSEGSYDYLRFYINDVQQNLISGWVDWQQMVYTLGEGTNTLRWSYTKDGSVNSGSDCGWVDQVIFTPGSIEYYQLSVVANPSYGGSVYGSGYYFEGQNVNVSAYPNTGFQFMNWTIDENVVSYSSSFSFLMPDNELTIVANFSEQEAYLVTFNVVDIVENPIEDAEISIWDYSYGIWHYITTNSSGQATISLQNGEYYYSAYKDGYYESSGYFNVWSSALNLWVTLEEYLDTPYGLTAELDSENGLVSLSWYFDNDENDKGFQHFKVYRNGYLLATTTQTTLVDELPNYGYYYYYVTAQYDEGESWGSNEAYVYWTADSYTLTINVFDIYGLPIENAFVTVCNYDDCWEGFTNSLGVFTQELPSNDYYGYSVQKEGFLTAEGWLYLENNMNINVVLYEEFIGPGSTCTEAVEYGDVDGHVVYGTTSSSAPYYWYKFTIPTTYYNLSVSTCYHSNFDTQLEVWADCEDSWYIGQNDDYCGAQSQVNFSVLEAGTYYVKVYGWGSSTGNYGLHINGSTEPQSYVLTLVANPVQGGTVYGSGTYNAWEYVEVSAEPNEGYWFVNWTYDGTIVSNYPSFEFNMPSQDVTLTANFVDYTEYLVTFNVYDASENPIYNATISIYDYIFQEYYYIYTDASGQASIPLHNGDYWYSVYKNGYFEATDYFIVNGSNLVINVLLEQWVDAPYGLTADLNPQTGEVLLNWLYGSGDAFFEDFNNGLPGSWSFSDDRFYVDGGYLNMIGESNNTWASCFHNSTFADFVFEFEVVRDQSSATQNNSLTAFIRSSGFLNNNSDANGYFININVNGYYSVWKMVNGAEQSIIPWLTSPYINTGLNASNIVTVVAYGNEFYLFVNGELVNYFTDNTFSSGHVGLAAYDSNAGEHLVKWNYAFLDSDFKGQPYTPERLQMLEKKTSVANSNTSDDFGYTSGTLLPVNNEFVSVNGLVTKGALAIAKEFQNFKVYRNGGLLNTTTQTYYLDQLPQNGDYYYYVTAMHDEGESESTSYAYVSWYADYFTLTIQAVDIVGNPIVDALVEVCNYNDCWEGYTNADGLFAVELPSYEYYYIDIEKAGYQPYNNWVYLNQNYNLTAVMYEAFTGPGSSCAEAVEYGNIDGHVVSGTTTTTASYYWYKFTLPVTYYNLSVSTCNHSNFDTQLQVWDDCEDNWYIAHNDDYCGTQSQINFGSLEAGTYYVKVYGFGSSTGNYGLHINGSTEIETYSVTLLANPANGGTVSGAGNYVADEYVYISASAATGYTFINWTDHAQNVVSTSSEFAFYMPNYDVTYTANFVYGYHTITATAGANGTITPSGNVSVLEGGSQTFIFTPFAGYQVAEVIVDGVSVGAPSFYTFTNVTSNHTIHVEFSAITYTITASAGSNGTISPSGTINVVHGGSQTFTITPNAGYVVNNVYVDGVSLGAITSYTFSNVTNNHYIHATFKLQTYTISASAGPNGTITPSGNVLVNHGTNKEFTITPALGYQIEDVLVDGVSVGAVTSYTFVNVTQNHTIHATFVVSTYTITATYGANGTITPSGVITLPYGSNQTFNITPNTGYYIASITVDGVSVGVPDSYTFYNLSANHTIHATFTDVEPIVHVITASAGPNGNIAPSGLVNVVEGDNITFSITPNTGYQVANVMVDGASVGAVNSYTFTNVIAAHTISAEFVINTFIISASTSGNGSITPSGNVEVNYGASQAFVMTPSVGYYLADVLVDGYSAMGSVSIVDGIGTYTFASVNANHTIHAVFEQVTLTIVATAGSNGTIVPGGSVYVGYGQNKTFSIVPNTGYYVASLFIDGVSVNPATSYTFTNVTANHTIHAEFALNTYTIYAVAGVGGTITPSGNVVVNHGSDITFTIAPNTGYFIANVIVNGQSVGTPTSYTFVNVVSSQTIVVEFEQTEPSVFTIVATSGSNGSIAPSGSVSVPQGDDATFTITPAMGYAIADVVVNGVSVLGSVSFIGDIGTYTFVNVQANHTIHATFALKSFIITATAGTGGSINPTGEVSVQYGQSQMFTITPNEGFYIASVMVDGLSVGAVSSYTFYVVNANHTIHATFTDVEPVIHHIFATAGPNGNISPSGLVPVVEGDNVTFTVQPNIGYHIQDVRVDGVSVGANSSYTFENVTQEHVIHALFEINTYVITAIASEGGIINPSGEVQVTHGANQVFTIVPYTGYHISNVTIDGVSVGAVNMYIFTNVTTNRTINAFFELNTYTLTYLAGNNGTIAGETNQVVNFGEDGTPVEAIPDYGFSFYRWSDGRTDNPRTDISVTANVLVTAQFVINTYTLTYLAGANGSLQGNTVQVVQHGGSGTPVEAIPEYGFQFVQWSDGIIENPRTDMNVTSSLTVTALFEVAVYTITVDVLPESGGTVTGAGQYVHGALVTLIATPSTFYSFVNWTEDGSEVSDQPIFEFTATVNRHLVANFRIEGNPVIVTVVPAGAGVITGEGYYSEGSEVALTATPTTGYYFVSWTGADGLVTSNNPYIFVMPNDTVRLYANFYLTNVPSDPLAALNVYPNPFNNSITLTNAGGVSKVVFVNLIGQKVMEVDLFGVDREIISTDKLMKGVYLVHFETENGKRRIVKMVKE